MNNIIKSLN